jgi:hypothetical protein
MQNLERKFQKRKEKPEIFHTEIQSEKKAKRFGYGKVS